jgi:enterochelin esterase-like enzyme
MTFRLLPGALLAVCGAHAWAAPVATPAGAAEAVSPTRPSRWVTPAVQAPGVTRHLFASAAARTEVSFHLYSPPAYAEEPARRFPVLYWLHGTGGGLQGIAPLAAWFDAAIRAGKMPPVLVVFPHGMATSMWCDAKDGAVPMETVVVRELVPHVDATFRTVARREGRIVEGFSMGGYGAARWGCKFPDVFGTVSCLAGGPLDLEFAGPRTKANPAERAQILRTTFGDDLDYFRAQSPIALLAGNAAAVRGRMHVRVAVGGRDFTAALNREFSAHLTRHHIRHAFTEVPGVGHDTLALLKGLGDANWLFYREALAAVATAGAAPATSLCGPMLRPGDHERAVATLPDKADDGTRVVRTTWGGGRAGGEVVPVTIGNGGHTWPGMKPIGATPGRATMDISANDLMGEFFRRHPRRPAGAAGK